VNILILENMLLPHGGQEISLLELCQRLSKRNHKIILLYRMAGEFLGVYRGFCDSIKHVSTYSINHRQIRSYFDFLISFCKGLRMKPDVIYANQYLDSLYAGLLSRALRVPFVCHLRLPPPETLCTQFRVGLSNVAKMIAVSSHTRQSWVRFGFSGEKIAVIHNGVSMERYLVSPTSFKDRLCFGIPQNAFVITYAGRIKEGKGIHVLFSAFKELKKIIPQSFLVIASPFQLPADESATYPQSLKALEEHLGLRECVLWLKNCSNMSLLFGCSDVTVLPSLWPEPFGRVLIESMACGTPAVASRVGGIPEILTGEFSRFLFESGDSRGLCQILLQILDWRKRDSQLSSRCRKHVEENFGLGRCVDSVEGVLYEAVR
jgi:glycosyltransferase involved in cell wall biosynthesis